MADMIVRLAEQLFSFRFIELSFSFTSISPATRESLEPLHKCVAPAAERSLVKPSATVPSPIAKTFRHIYVKPINGARIHGKTLPWTRLRLLP